MGTGRRAPPELLRPRDLAPRLATHLIRHSDSESASASVSQSVSASVSASESVSDPDSEPDTGGTEFDRERRRISEFAVKTLGRHTRCFSGGYDSSYLLPSHCSSPFGLRQQ
jgi:hypothetical protein